MYEQFFALRSRPFDLTPDPRFMFMTPQHARAVANVKFALMNRDSFVILSGEIGIGKTTIINNVLTDLGPDYVTAKLTHTTLTEIELLQALLSAFGMPNYSKKKVLLLDTLRDFFLDKQREGKHVVIIVDEAQNLSAEALEELRLLSCIDTSDQRIVSIVLTGQRGLDDVIDSPNMRQLRQRARLRQRLEAMSEPETFAYIRHRLEVAGGDVDRLFTPEALREVHRLAFGIPRLINTLCDTAMMGCFVDEKSRVTLEEIDYAAHELRWHWLEEREEERLQSRRPPAAPPRPLARLMVSREGQPDHEVQIHQFPFVIGRSSANDLVIVDKEVSRRHALIDCIGGVYVIEDLNSKNGILVNGTRRARALLRPGDIITCGRVDVCFQADLDRDGRALLDNGEPDHAATVASDPEPEPMAAEDTTADLKNKRLA